MKQSLLHIFLTLLTTISVVSCTIVSEKNTPSIHSAADNPHDSAFIARASLSLADQRSYDKLYLDAICEKLKGNTGTTRELLSHALEINPNASEALYEMALLQLGAITPNSQYSKEDSTALYAAQDLLEKAYRLEPSNPYIRTALAKHYLQNYELEEAVDLYTIIAKETPNEENLTILFRLYDLLLEHDKALETLDHMENMMGYTDDIAIGRYRIYDKQDKPAEAFAAIERLCKEHPNDMRYRSMLADVCIDQGDTLKALALYQEVLDADPSELNAYNGLLVYYVANGKMEEFHQLLSQLIQSKDIDAQSKFSFIKTYAISIAQKQIAISPTEMLVHFNEALDIPQADSELCQLTGVFVDFFKDELDERVVYEVFQKILSVTPEDYQARLYLLQKYIQEENTQAIIELCNEGTQLHPNEIIFYYYEGFAYYELDRNAESIDAFLRGTTVINDETDPEAASDLYALLGDRYHDEGMTDKAYAAYDKALSYNPNNISCLNNFAYYLTLEDKDLDKALSMAVRVIEAYPEEPTYLDTYAWVLFKEGQYTMAKIYIDKTLKNTPEDELELPSTSSLYDHAGDIYFHCGDADKALEYWKKARNISDDQNMIKKLNKKIKSKKP